MTPLQGMQGLRGEVVPPAHELKAGPLQPPLPYRRRVEMRGGQCDRRSGGTAAQEDRPKRSKLRATERLGSKLWFGTQKTNGAPGRRTRAVSTRTGSTSRMCSSTELLKALAKLPAGRACERRQPGPANSRRRERRHRGSGRPRVEANFQRAIESHGGKMTIAAADVEGGRGQVDVTIEARLSTRSRAR